jgi:ABC-type multidrug transport system fused ATPase/permease subunit
VRQADRIYVLEAGQISEQGTHDELLRNSGGKYSKLVRLQLQKA